MICLLTTPESLEVMLVSRRTDKISLFQNIRVVIVDETPCVRRGRSWLACACCAGETDHWPEGSSSGSGFRLRSVILPAF